MFEDYYFALADKYHKFIELGKVFTQVKRILVPNGRFYLSMYKGNLNYLKELTEVSGFKIDRIIEVTKKNAKSSTAKKQLSGKNSKSISQEKHPIRVLLRKEH